MTRPLALLASRATGCLPRATGRLVGATGCLPASVLPNDQHSPGATGCLPRATGRLVGATGCLPASVFRNDQHRPATIQSYSAPIGNGIVKAFVLAIAPLCLVASPQAALAQDSPRQIDLSGHWEFAYTPSHTEQIPPASAFKTTMPVPGCWDDTLPKAKAKALWPDAHFNPDYRPLQLPVTADFGQAPDASLPFLLGTGWYRKTIDVPADWKGRQVTLCVGRTVMEAGLYLNKRLVHHHRGHSVPWEVALSNHLRPGQPNELVIAVDNTRTDRLGSDIRGWKGRSAGIFGPIALKIARHARIADLFVFLQGDQLAWRVQLEGKDLPGATLKWKILDPRLGTVLAEGDQDVADDKPHWTSSAQGLPRWSDREPTLLQVELSLWSGQTRLDLLRQPLGLRRLAVNGAGLQLNGNPIFLRGLCEDAYFPKTCTPPLEAAWYQQRVQKFKDLGFNWLRAHTWVPAEPYLQAADELGMLVQVEPPVGYQLDEWRDIIRACRKHPSVVLYCCGNEEMLDEPKIAFLRACAAELRREAPDALFNPQEAMRGVEYFLEKLPPDVLSQEPFPHHPRRLATLREFSDVFGQYALGLLSYHSLQGNAAELDRRLAVYQRPCLTHELGICGCYLNLELERRYEGTRIGTDLFVQVRKAMADAGLLDRANTYYRNASAWQRLTLKDAAETARQCRLLAGYDLLGAFDCHWHRSGYDCGLMNEFDELKWGRSVADILQFNGESVLLIGNRRDRNLKAGEPLVRDLSVSWFGAQPLRDATATWTLKAADGTLLGKGSAKVDPIAPGDVKKIATIDLATPNADSPRKATLEVQLAGDCGKIANHWEYWIFPDVSATRHPNVLLVDALDADTLEKLASGARVLLLGHKPLAALPTSFQMALAGRADGNLATVITDHPLMKRFPHDGYCDWQFAKMLEGGSAVVFDAKDVPFEPILEVASSYKRIVRQAAIFQWRIGPGRLLVCSLRLPPDDPAAAYLRSLLLNYAASDAFQPGTSITAEQLTQALKPPKQDQQRQTDTDKALDQRGQLPKQQPTAIP